MEVTAWPRHTAIWVLQAESRGHVIVPGRVPEGLIGDRLLVLRDEGGRLKVGRSIEVMAAHEARRRCIRLKPLRNHLVVRIPRVLKLVSRAVHATWSHVLLIQSLDELHPLLALELPRLLLPPRREDTVCELLEAHHAWSFIRGPAGLPCSRIMGDVVSAGEARLQLL
jgi:hypothetical protein